MCGKPQIVLKRDSKSVLQYNDAKIAQNAVEQFKELINDIREEQQDRDEITENMPMVEREPLKEQIDEIDRIDGLTEEGKWELRGVLNPSKSIDKSTRPTYLKVQLDHVKNTLDNTTEERDRTDNPEKFIYLEERVIGLQKGKDLKSGQKKTWLDYQQ